MAGGLGLVWPGGEDAAAHDLKAKCKKKSGEAKKKCLKKAKQHAAEHAAEDTSGGGGNEQPPPHVCAGRNFCTSPAAVPLCQTSGQDCVCVVTAGGAPFCAATKPSPGLR